MKTAPLLLSAASILFSACTADDMDYFWNGPRDGSYSPASSSSSSDTQQWHQMQRQAEFQQQSQAYKSGWTTTPPAGYSPY
jgi:hypothetical protein